MIDICLCLSQASKLYKEARSQGACLPPHTHTPHSPFFLAGNIFLKFTYEKLNYNRVGSLISWMHYVKENEMKMRELRVKLKLYVYYATPFLYFLDKSAPPPSSPKFRRYVPV